MEYLEETTRGELTRAWQNGMMSIIDPKRYPRQPDILWDKKAGEQTVDQMIAMAKAMAGKKPH